MKRIFIPTPQRIPISNFSTRHAINVPNPGIRSDSETPSNHSFVIYIQLYIICNVTVFTHSWKKKKRKENVLLLFVLHIGRTTFTSTMKMTAAIMIAARVARGIKLKYGVRNSKAKITNTPKSEKVPCISTVYT